MAVESAADRASLLADFGEAITWGAATITGLAHAGSLRLEGMDGAGAMSAQAAVLCRSADLPGDAAAGDAVSFRGTAHTVRAIEPDGTGMTLVRLEETVAD